MDSDDYEECDTEHSANALRRARDLPWTHGAFARRHDGSSTDPQDPEAVCFCALGAVLRSCLDESQVVGDVANIALFEAARESLNDFLVTGREAVVRFNDSPSRTREQVRALFDRAIAKLEADL